MNNPNLVEPGTKYFINQTLKQCRQKNINFYNTLFNVVLLVSFLGLAGGILYYKKATKPTIQDKIDKEHAKRMYLINKLKIYNHKMLKQSQELITNLPMYQNEFNKL